MLIFEIGRSSMGAGVDGGHVCTTPSIDRRPLLQLVSLMVRAVYTGHASAPSRSYQFIMRRWPKKVFLLLIRLQLRCLIFLKLTR